MTIRKIVAVYFSPTGNAKKIATNMAGYVQERLQNSNNLKYGVSSEDGVPIDYVDFTLSEHRLNVREFAQDELVIFAVPVYAGRVPNKVLPFVQSLFKGNHTPVVPMVTYGNRSYDNALKELCMELDKNGFLAVGAAAIVGEHAFSNKLAPGRPDTADMNDLQTFADKIADKFICPMDRSNLYLDLDEIPGDWPLERYYTPLGMDGKPAVFLKAKPKTNELICDQCSICTNSCPMGSISKTDCTTVEGICIKCQACIKSCPNGAKYFDDEAFLSHVKMLETHYGEKRKACDNFI